MPTGQNVWVRTQNLLAVSRRSGCHIRACISGFTACPPPPTVPSAHLRLHGGLVPAVAARRPGGRGASLPVPVPGLPLLRGSEEECGGDHGNLPGRGFCVMFYLIMEIISKIDTATTLLLYDAPLRSGPGGGEVHRVLWALPPADVRHAQVLPVLHRRLQDHLLREDRPRGHAGRAHEDRYTGPEGLWEIITVNTWCPQYRTLVVVTFVDLNDLFSFSNTYSTIYDTIYNK